MVLVWLIVVRLCDLRLCLSRLVELVWGVRCGCGLFVGLVVRFICWFGGEAVGCFMGLCRVGILHSFRVGLVAVLVWFVVMWGFGFVALFAA